MGCFSTLWHKDTFSWLLSAIVFLLFFFRYLEQSALCVLMCSSHSTGALSKLLHTARHCQAHILSETALRADTSQEWVTTGALAGSHRLNMWAIKWPKWSVIISNCWNQLFTAAHKVFCSWKIESIVQNGIPVTASYESVPFIERFHDLIITAYNHDIHFNEARCPFPRWSVLVVSCTVYPGVVVTWLLWTLGLFGTYWRRIEFINSNFHWWGFFFFWSVFQHANI